MTMQHAGYNLGNATMKIFGLGATKTTSDHQELKDRFDTDGFAVLPGFFSAEFCDRVLSDVELYTSPNRPSNSRITIDILHGVHGGRRVFVRDAPREAFGGPFKINHLFTESAAVAEAVFDPGLRAALHSLLGAEPVAINSLNFNFGSQQPEHIDTWYMPPPKPGSLVVTSLSLEDVREDAGPLFYYPGSHRIPPYRFSHGGLHAVDTELPECRRYLEAELGMRGLKKHLFFGKKGDVFIWHCQLLHGGTPIRDLDRSRSSLVVHYWGADATLGAPVAATPSGGKYLDRDYWETDGKLIPSSPAPVQPIPIQVVSPAVAVPVAPEFVNPATHIAFRTWEARGETLESVEARIHDGASIRHLHDRADSYLKTFERLFPGSAPDRSARIMEIGSGVGYVIEAALRRYKPSKIIGLDVAQGMIDVAKRRLTRDRVNTSNIEFVHYDGVDVPLPAESLDFIYSVASLQHAPRPYCFRALMEAYRLIRRGGVVFIHLLDYSHFAEHATTETFKQELQLQIRQHEGHWHHYYTAQEIEAVLRYGIGVPAECLKTRELSGSLYSCFRKP